MQRQAKITSKGQITLPLEIRPPSAPFCSRATTFQGGSEDSDLAQPAGDFRGSVVIHK